MKTLSFLIFSATLFFSFSFHDIFVVHAQEIINIAEQATELGLDELSAPSVILDVSSNGTPGSIATVKARTENINDNASTFDWYLDDQPMLLASGRAKTELSFQTTKPFHVVRVVVSLGKERIAENASSVQSFAVSLTWDADTFIPADYKGKALPSVGSRITVTAFPEIRGEAPENLLYTWYLDAESKVRNSIAEQEFSFIASKNVSFVSIMVEVSNLSQSITVRKAIVIPIVRPVIIINDSRSLFLIPGGKALISASPLYFHASSMNEIAFRWTFEGNTILGTPPNPHELTLIIPSDSGTGSRYLTVEAENNAVIGERAKSDLEITIF